MTDLAGIFAKDPLDLTKDDIHLVVQHMRGKRAQFLSGNKAAGTVNAPKPKTATGQAALDLSKELLGDLKL